MFDVFKGNTDPHTTKHYVQSTHNL